MSDLPEIIVCPKCGSRYKKPANIPESGINLKCKNCQTLFSISGEIKGTAQFKYDDSLVKRSDGSVFRIKDLAELQKKIIQTILTENDEISSNGTDWKKLSEQTELSPFFSAVRAMQNPVVYSESDIENESEQKLDVYKKNEKFQTVIPPKEPVYERDSSLTIPPPENEPEKVVFEDNSMDDIYKNEEEPFVFEERKIPWIKLFVLVMMFGAIGSGIYLFIDQSSNKVTAIRQNKPADLNEKNDQEIQEKPIVHAPKIIEPKPVFEPKIIPPAQNAKKEVQRKENIKKSDSSPKLSSRQFVLQGRRFFENGKNSEAIAAFQKALEINQNEADAHLGLGDVYGETGKKQEAKSEYQKYLDLKPKAKNSDEIRNLINNM